MVEMTIESIRVSLMNYQRVVILKEKASDRYLPSGLAPPKLTPSPSSFRTFRRPSPHTRPAALGHRQLGAIVKHVFVNDLSNDTFYARIVLEWNGGPMEIDSRPSDAIALAVRVRCRSSPTSRC